MRVLLGTHAFLWWVEDAPALSKKAKAVIGDPDNECLLSLASCWEMAIKLSLGKLRLPGAIERFIPEQLAANAFRQLAIGPSSRSIVTRSTACSLRRPWRSGV